MRREMDKTSPNVTRGQAAEYFGLSKNALRNYETMCLVDPKVGENGYRHYHEEDISALSAIRMYRDMGYTLQDVQKLMRCGSIQILSDAFMQHQNELFSMQEELICQARKCFSMQERLNKAKAAPVIEERQMGIELLWKPRIDQTDKIGDETDKRWMSAFPDVNISGILEFSDEHLVSVECGMAIEKYKQRQYDLQTEEKTREIVIKHCIYGILPCHIREGNYVLEDYIPLFQYAQKRGLKPKNKVYTMGLAACHMDQNPEYYLELWLPIDDEE